MVHPEPTLAIIGVTGKQGNAVCEAMLANRACQFRRIRGITRNLDSDKSRRLRARGVDMRVADLDDQDSLRAALDGCTAVFAMTDYWQEPIMRDPKVEIQQGVNIADVCKDLGVSHVIFSSLEDAEEISKGRFKLPSFTNKARVEQYMRKIGLPCVSFVYPMMFMQNFLNLFPPTRCPDGAREMRFNCAPTTRLPLTDIDDLGRVVMKMFEQHDRFNGASVPIYGDRMTFTEMARTWEEVCGQRCRFVQISSEDMKKASNQEVADMYAYFDACGMNEHCNAKTSMGDAARQLNPGLHSFRQWLEANKSKLC